MSDLEDDDRVSLHSINDPIIPDAHFPVSNQAFLERAAGLHRIDPDSLLDGLPDATLDIFRNVLDIFGDKRVVEELVDHGFFHSLLCVSAFPAENVFSLSAAAIAQ